MTDENESDTSSLEIYLALTSQLLSDEEIAKQKLSLLQQQYYENKQQNQTVVPPKKPPNVVKIQPIVKKKTMTDTSDDPAVFSDPAINFFDNMAKELNKKDAFIRSESEEGELLDDLIRVEDIFIAHMIAKCLKLCPSAFENVITKDEIMSLISKASRFLWTNVGGTLEHYLLWWAQFPLACRPVSCTKYLRDYLMLITPDDAPEPILSTLKSLGEILTVHAVSTSWDKNFRICLVLSSQRVDQSHDKNTEFYVPEEQVNLLQIFYVFVVRIAHKVSCFYEYVLFFLFYVQSYLVQRVVISGAYYSSPWFQLPILVTVLVRLPMNCQLSNKFLYYIDLIIAFIRCDYGETLKPKSYALIGI